MSPHRLARSIRLGARTRHRSAGSGLHAGGARGAVEDPEYQLPSANWATADSSEKLAAQFRGEVRSLARNAEVMPDFIPLEVAGRHHSRRSIPRRGDEADCRLELGLPVDQWEKDDEFCSWIGSRPQLDKGIEAIMLGAAAEIQQQNRMVRPRAGDTIDPVDERRRAEIQLHADSNDPFADRHALRERENPAPSLILLSTVRSSIR